MSGFNEANTIEEAIRDRLAALPGDHWTFIQGENPRRVRQNAIAFWAPELATAG